MRSEQLDCEVEETDTIYLAKYFDGVEYYLSSFGLTSAEQTDVRNLDFRKGTQVAINSCLCLWRRHDPSTATVRTLLEILLRLGKEEIASKVCNHYYTQSKFELRLFNFCVQTQFMQVAG